MDLMLQIHSSFGRNMRIEMGHPSLEKNPAETR